MLLRLSIHDVPVWVNFPMWALEKRQQIVALRFEQCHLGIGGMLNSENSVWLRICYNEGEWGVMQRCPIVLSLNSGHPFLYMKYESEKCVWKTLISNIQNAKTYHTIQMIFSHHELAAAFLINNFITNLHFEIQNRIKKCIHICNYHMRLHPTAS